MWNYTLSRDKLTLVSIHKWPIFSDFGIWEYRDDGQLSDKRVFLSPLKVMVNLFCDRRQSLFRVAFRQWGSRWGVNGGSPEGDRSSLPIPPAVQLAPFVFSRLPLKISTSPSRCVNRKLTICDNRILTTLSHGDQIRFKNRGMWYLSHLLATGW